MTPTTKQEANTILIQFGSLEPFKFNSHKKHLIITQMMIKGQQWMRVRVGRWLLVGDGRRDEHSLFIWLPKSLEEHKTRFSLGQEEGAIKGKKNWEQKCMTIRNKPKNFKISSHWKNSSPKNSFKMTQQRPFTQSLIMKFMTKKRMSTMMVQMRLCHFWRNSNLRLMKLNPCNPPPHQKKCSPKLLKSQRCTTLIPTHINKFKNVTRAF